MDLPFDGGISRFYNDSASDAVRTAIADAKKGEILNPDYPYDKRMKRAAYEARLGAVDPKVAGTHG